VLLNSGRHNREIGDGREENRESPSNRPVQGKSTGRRRRREGKSLNPFVKAAEGGNKERGEGGKETPATEKCAQRRRALPVKRPKEEGTKGWGRGTEGGKL